MKKYFFPLVAVLLAIGFSAFTAPSKSASAKQADEYLFWYFYDQGNDELNGQIGTVEKTHADAKEATQCLDNQFSVIECARGYEEEKNPYQISPGTGDDRVKDIDPGK